MSTFAQRRRGPGIEAKGKLSAIGNQGLMQPQAGNRLGPGTEGNLPGAQQACCFDRRAPSDVHAIQGVAVEGVFSLGRAWFPIIDSM